LDTIAAIIDSRIPKSPVRPRHGEMGEEYSSKRTTLPAKFESDVFAHLEEKGSDYGIARVLRAKNLLVDGRVELTDGRFLGVEVKYCMNWPLACQSGWQFSQFLQRPEAAEWPASGGIVIFEKFTGDWARLLQGTERGWHGWYSGHECLPERQEFRIDLIRFAKNELKRCPTF